MKVIISKHSLQGTTVTKPLHTLQRVSFAPTNVHANDNLGRTGGTYCDGTITCFHENNVTTGVSEIRQTNIDFRIYPNPTTDELNFSLSNTNKIDIKIEIVDVLGQRIKLINYKQVSQSFHDQISMNDISEGVYFIKAYYDSKITTCKFIKQ